MNEQPFLLAALAAAQQHQGFCAPNPAVGAVLVKNNKIIANGYHRGPGTAHAEVDVVRQLPADFDFTECTLYVTLEPCCVWGRTPPCTDLLIKHQIPRVIFAYYDPNPQVAGQGQQLVQQAGSHCEHLAVPEIDKFYQAYAYWWQTKTPWRIAKLALSLDGKIAGPAGEPVAITGAATAEYTQQLRKHADALLTTARTINTDNPRFNVRCNDGAPIKKPLYVIDPRLIIVPNARIFTHTGPVTLLHLPTACSERRAALQAVGAQCLALTPTAQQQFNFAELWTLLGANGHHQVLIEAGGQLFERLLQARELQQAILYVAPKVLGAEATGSFQRGWDFSAEKSVSWQLCGEDAICTISF